jgi:hypothetical protein
MCTFFKGDQFLPLQFFKLRNDGPTPIIPVFENLESIRTQELKLQTPGSTYSSYYCTKNQLSKWFSICKNSIIQVFF